MAAYTGHQQAFRRTSKQELVEFGQQHAPAIVNPPANRCDLCNDEQVALRYMTPKHPHVCQPCWDAYAIWDEVLDLVDSIDAAAPLGYDPGCGMQPDDEWRRDFAFSVLNDRIWCGMPEDPLDGATRDLLGLSVTPFDEWATGDPKRKLDIDWIRNKPSLRYSPPKPQNAPQKPREPLFGCLDKVALEDIVTCPDPTGAVHNGHGKPTTTILPQLLQSNEDILEAIAMTRTDVDLSRLTELYEATVFGVEHWDNQEARILFDGFFLRSIPDGAFVHLAHSEHHNHITVGVADMITRKMQFVSSRGEIKTFVQSVIDGPRKLAHPCLQSLNEPDVPA